MAFIYPYVVRFRDTDAAGVMYFANVLAICHDAYEAALGDAGIVLVTFFGPGPLAIPIVHSSVDFRRPLRCGDALIIHGHPQRQGDHGFEIHYDVQGPEAKTAATVTTRHLCIDTATRRRHPLPEILDQWLQAMG
ncbi:acyl-CoA thioesterase [Leptolyngbya sp. PCC 6406]|uniref:acyl-CoA thioesterase n=1 Tax=Leptolyngbya sp. PCC 6406 TaxID=1173264 RepID=UPI0002AC13D2|nr:thioesterase family protein [Leptolyngbya sp. PCC 6406]